MTSLAFALCYALPNAVAIEGSALEGEATPVIEQEPDNGSEQPLETPAELPSQQPPEQQQTEQLPEQQQTEQQQEPEQPAPSVPEMTKESAKTNDKGKATAKNAKPKASAASKSAPVKDVDKKLKEIETELKALEKSKESFLPAHASFLDEKTMYASFGPKLSNLKTQINKCEKDARKAQAVIDALEIELAQGKDYDILDVLAGTVKVEDIESRPYMMNRVLEAETEALANAKDEGQRLRLQYMHCLESQGYSQSSVQENAAAACIIAYEMERGCARARQLLKETNQAIDKLDMKVEGMAAEKARVIKAASDSAMAVGEYEALVGVLYDDLDSSAGVSGAISFGEGMDFLMPETDFVEKWGNAIDAFYESLDFPPLAGYGKVMATAAYKYKIDPRLCAAVSIAESSGGRVCIRPHNAWGWGAADSDPYNLALEWDSFDTAIEEWHKGMAMSKTGLATAQSVSSLGSIYCSSPIWGETVITYMEQISEFTR